MSLSMVRQRSIFKSSLLSTTEAQSVHNWSGKTRDEIDVDLRLTTIKPLHAQWLIEIYNYFSTEKGVKIIFKGRKKSRVSGVLDGSFVLPPEDPFSDLYTSS